MKNVKVKLQTNRARTVGEAQLYGDVITVPADEAQRMIKAQQAELVTATRSAPRTAATRTGTPPARTEM